MSLKFEVSKRRLMYIKLANKELLKNCASKTGSVEIVQACDRLTTSYTMPKPIITVKADGSLELKDAIKPTVEYSGVA